ncbi:uncharacterized protein DUF397 [Stackebrandtia endophytica]|uniref:Uncharacterized protein DUF397 n=1 Tax=Stackebrandtia endophytica TaxID=1496996 RepID=A0A543B0U5_9ACTN|nr:uncharacterized protein DUF397 [Stackebrandtia endophytica]
MTPSPIAPNRLRWRKASRSSNGGGQCVEAAADGTQIAIRDSKLDTTGCFPYLAVGATEWKGLLHTVQTLAE